MLKRRHASKQRSARANSGELQGGLTQSHHQRDGSQAARPTGGLPPPRGSVGSRPGSPDGPHQTGVPAQGDLQPELGRDTERLHQGSHLEALSPDENSRSFEGWAPGAADLGVGEAGVGRGVSGDRGLEGERYSLRGGRGGHREGKVGARKGRGGAHVGGARVQAGAGKRPHPEVGEAGEPEVSGASAAEGNNDGRRAVIRLQTGQQPPPVKRRRSAEVGGYNQRPTRSLKNITMDFDRNAAINAADKVAKFVVFQAPVARVGEMDVEVRRQIIKFFGKYSAGKKYEVAIRHTGYRGRSAMREQLSKCVDKAYGLDNLGDGERLEKVKRLLHRSAFVCHSDHRNRHGAHFLAAEIPRIIVDAYIAPSRSNHGYCRSMEEFLNSISAQFICIIAAGIGWWLKGWMAGNGFVHEIAGEFSSENLRGECKPEWSEIVADGSSGLRQLHLPVDSG